ncbi:FG-GAP repeat domain-containing protein [Streptomyces sp. NPDC007910]|uniref:FG-GAP-like repeat-containing protein n=1 Tax=unclassified Streptomyces TaxID=2593676 RepID=UPI0036E18876
MLLMPTATANQPGQRPSTEAIAAQEDSLPLSDLNGDGVNDLLYRGLDGQLYSSTRDKGDPYSFYPVNGAKDIIPIGDQGGFTTGPEILTVGPTGELRLFTDAHHRGVAPESHVVGGGWQVYNKIVSPGDVNGDRRADVMARTYDGQLYLYLATGNLYRPLGTRVRVGGGWGVYDQLVGLGDGNGDGRADLYARDHTGTLWFYAGTGNATTPFRARRSVGGGWNIYNQIMPTGNGGLWARDNTGTLYFYPGTGSGSLAGRQKRGEQGEWAGVVQFAGAGNIPSYAGKEQALATTSGGAAYWYHTNTMGGLAPRQAIVEEGGWKGFSYFNVSSIGGGPFSDTALVNDGDLYLSNMRYTGDWDAYNSIVGPGDLNDDGRGDLLVRDGSGTLYLCRSNGIGREFAARIRIGGGWGIYNKLFGSGDYTGDGRMDLLARTTSGELYLYPGTGIAATPFKPRVKVGNGWSVYKHLIAPGDLNSDGKGDVIGVTSGGDLYRYLNTTPNKFSTGAKIGHGYGIYNHMS